MNDLNNDALKMPKICGKDFNFSKALKDLVGVLKLDKKVIDEVANDVKGGFNALVFLIVGAIAGPLGFLLFGLDFGFMTWRPDVGSQLIAMVLMIALNLFFIFVVSFVSVKFFKGKGTFAQFFRVIGLVGGLNVFMFIVPLMMSLGSLISLVVGIWALVASYVTLKTVFKMDDTNTILTIIVSVVVYVVVMFILMRFGIMNPYAMGGGMGNFNYDFGGSGVNIKIPSLR